VGRASVGRRKRFYTEDAEAIEGVEKKKSKKGTACRAPTRLGAEEDGFALEHFDGDEEGGGGVDAGGGEDDGD